MPELIWQGKYDEQNRRVAPAKIALPFQTIETVNESAADRERTRSLFADAGKTEWRNRLIWGDKRHVLPSLLPELAGQVNLIYIDPPFDTGANFSFTAQIADDPDTPGNQSTSFVKEPSILELKAYRDIWGNAQNHLDSYLKWFYETVAVLHDLLAPNGSIYVHVDYNVVHYVKAVLDGIFGADNFINQIIWQRTNAHNINAKYFSKIHDTILFFAKSQDFVWNPQYTDFSEQQLKRYKPDEKGRLYTGQDLTISGSKRNFEWRGSRPPSHRGWALSLEELERRWNEGRILTKQDGTPRLDGLKVYLDELQGKRATDLWMDVSRVGNTSDERLNYPTQKPEALLERIIKASSNEGDLVLDCFCGSGTTAAVAEKLQRRWITCDLGRFAIHTARKRLLGIENVRPFVVQNLGKYERQAWMQEETDKPVGRALLPDSQRNQNENDGQECPSHNQAQSQAHNQAQSQAHNQAQSQAHNQAQSQAQSQAHNQRERWERQRRYTEFILQLYRATPLSGYLWLHGVKSGRHVHVGSVDAPISDGDLKQIAAEFRRAVGTGSDAPTTNGLDILGWDFAFEVNEAAKQQMAQANLDVRFRLIPREVMERKAVEQGDIQFFELAALEVEAKTKEKTVELELKNFAIAPDYVPEDVRRQITHWEQYLDYWAIDWNHGGVLSDTFHNQWQSYRTRTQKKLERKAKHTYEAAGTYRIVVKAIDILGNDTTKVLKVEV